MDQVVRLRFGCHEKQQRESRIELRVREERGRESRKRDVAMR